MIFDAVDGSHSTRDFIFVLAGCRAHKLSTAHDGSELEIMWKGVRARVSFIEVLQATAATSVRRIELLLQTVYDSFQRSGKRKKPENG